MWQILRTSHAKRAVRRAADVLFVFAAIGAVAHFFDDTNERFLWFVLAAGTVLYFLAPGAIVRHVAFRREADRETMLGALSTYVCFGMPARSPTASSPRCRTRRSSDRAGTGRPPCWAGGT